MKRGRGVLVGLGVSLGAAVLGLAGLEVGWRMLRTRSFGPTTNPLYVVRDDALGWRYVPGARVRHRAADFDVEVEIAENGFRDSTPAGAAERPIVTLGDSLTFGWGVDEREAFPALLEAATGVPVQNLGVSGYGTDQELLLFARDGRGLSPRAVVLTVCANDVEEVARRVSYGRAKPFFPGPELAPSASEPPAPEGWLVRRSHLARSLAKKWAERERPPLGPVAVAEARERVVGLIGELARLVGEPADGRPAPLMVLHADQAWLEAPLAERGIAVQDLTPALDRGRAAGAVAFAGDPHWNARGHGIVAAELQRVLAERGWLD